VQISASAGGSILCDPWVNPGANLGSWFHWPPVPEDFESQLLELCIDGIFISHLHSDHYDPNFISKFSKLRPEVPIYIPEFSHPWLKRSLKRVVSQPSRIIEIPTLAELEVASGLSLTTFAADTCNPLICLKNMPCQTDPTLRGIDGIAIFKGDGITLVNANDAMSVELLPKIAANIGQADVVMGHYGAASPYPQCFPEVLDQKLAALKIIERSCDMLIHAAESVGAKYIFPFAGQYVLGGRLNHLNENLAVLPLDETVNLLKRKTNIEILSVQPFGSVDLADLSLHKPYSEPTKSTKNLYFDKISKVDFIYERVKMKVWDDPELDLLQATNTVIEKSRKGIIRFDNSFVIGDGVHQITINFFPDTVKNYAEYGDNPRSETVTRITMPEPLLRMLSTRRKSFGGFTPLHWNQADGGSHFIWHRKGDFELNSHMLLNFFGT
jgi:UDP-MurNAc hydroxylase